MPVVNGITAQRPRKSSCGMRAEFSFHFQQVEGNREITVRYQARDCAVSGQKFVATETAIF